jgi:hypothetical membrane protein
MQKIAGVLFFLAGSIILMGIETAEIFYPPGYSVSLNMISTLGSTPPPAGIIHQPSAMIFDTSMILSGLLILAGSWILFRQKLKKRVVISFGLMGIGLVGVGIFPARTGSIHLFLALVTFLFGGIAAILSSSISRIPFAYFALILGIITLSFLFLGIFDTQLIVPILGPGGTERWAAYPLIIWLLGFGGYMMAREKDL